MILHHQVFKDIALLEKLGAQLDGVGGDSQLAVGVVFARPVDDAKAAGLRRVVDKPTVLAPQGLDPGVVGRRTPAKAPRREEDLRETVDVKQQAGGIGIGRRGQTNPALVGKDRLQVVLDRLILRFHRRCCAPVGLAARVGTRPTAATPLEVVAAIEVSANLVGVGAPIGTEVLAPQEAGLRLLATVRVGDEEDMNLMKIEQPGYVRVAPVVGQQVFGEAGHQLGGGVLARVDRAQNQDFRLVAGDRGVGQPQHFEVIALGPVLRLEIGIADIEIGGQRRVASDHRLRRGHGLFHRPVAGKAGNTEGLARLETRRVA